MEKLLRSRAFVLTVIVLPGLWPAWPIFRHDPTVLADPSQFLLHHFGFVACVLLATVLTFTPLRVLFPRSRPVQALNRNRRRVGVSAFVYALIHLTFQIIHEAGWPTFWTDVRMPFFLSGLAAFSILLVLAATSFDRAVRWLGGRRWKRLHRLVYLAAPLVAYHQATARKIFNVEVFWVFVPVAVLEIARITRQWSSGRAMSEPAPQPPASLKSGSGRA